MTTVFIAGSRNIKHLDSKVKERINNILTSKYNVVVGDASGADSSIQLYLCEHDARHTVVFCSGSRPRNNIGCWPIRSVATKFSPGSRAFFTAKDVQMAEVADYGLMIWDAKSTGTLCNVIELLKQRKKSVVFINKYKDFKTISDVSDLEDLTKYMSEHALSKAEKKIGLFNNIEALKNEQFKMFG